LLSVMLHSILRVLLMLEDSALLSTSVGHIGMHAIVKCGR
jgi:hypothetical protein